MDVLLIIDMQQAMVQGSPKHDLPGVVERINRLADRVRDRGGRVIFIQHDGAPGDDFAPFSPGWELLREMRPRSEDRVVRKSLNDAFRGTSLESDLNEIAADRVLVSGWATDLCVDSTIRSAAALAFNVVAVSDCHTVSDRPHMHAEKVIEHHHWVWSNLISPMPVATARESEL